MGFLQFASLAFLFLAQTQNELTISVMCFLANLSGAFLDVIVDALMVVQSRKDKDDGSEML